MKHIHRKDKDKEALFNVAFRARSILPCVGGGHKQARGQGGRLAPCGSRAKPWSGVQGAKPPTENDFQCFRMALKALPSMHYFVKRIIAFSRFSIVRNIKKIFEIRRQKICTALNTNRTTS